MTAAEAAQPVSRSLWVAAGRRFRRNRAATCGVVLLGVLAMLCVLGPFVATHAYDRVYQDYVRVPPALSAYPAPSQVEAAAARIASRLRTKIEGSESSGNSIRLRITSARPIDERSLALFARSDVFGEAVVRERAGEGATLTLEVPIIHRRFLLGTDGNGRDLLARTLVAGRVSLAIGLLAALVALGIGVAYGAVAGYAGGRTDQIMMRIVDILYALPFIFFVILLVVFFGRNFVLMFLAVGAIEWLDMARIVRGQTLSLRRQEYVLAAEALGVAPRDIVRRHIVPNLLGPVIVYTTLLIAKVILLESFLSFLGLGVQEPMTSWGVLIADGARNIQGAAWLLLVPAACLVTTLLALNFIGDGLRDALDPKDR